MACASLRSSARPWKYDVFLSFRGPDTRKGFISELYKQLDNRGIKTCKDELKIEAGDTISSTLAAAINESRCAIVVLSEKYASSTWCLEELTQICRCMEGENRILPLFYNVEPTDVRFQKKSFAAAFTNHEKSGRYTSEKLQEWIYALNKVANLSGWDSKNYKSDRELVKDIVQFVHIKLRPFEYEFAMSTGDFEEFKATGQTMNKIMKALESNEVAAVGVYGMGGVGKTTMVKRVAAQARKNGIFNEVIMAVVSQNPDLKKIQGALADLLGVKLENETEIGRADILNKEIMRRNKILIILDDVRERIELSNIGIPSYKELQKCNSKVLLTTRRQNVCDDCQEKITLDILSEEDSWTLFARNARRCFESINYNFYVVLRIVVINCRGLPILLIIVARVLEDKDLVEWKKVAQQLEDSQIAKPDDGVDAFELIKLCYDYLKHEESKSCFLLCCLFPYDSDIPIEDLFSYAIGTGLFRDADTIQEAREARGAFDSVVTHLKLCSLLLDGEKKGCVRMHYVIRDAAIEIAKSEYGLEFFIKAGSGLKDWPSRLHKGDGKEAIIQHSGRWQGNDYSCGGGNADNRSLHLCFAEYKGGKVSYVILEVKLCDIFFTSPSQKSQLRRLAGLSDNNLPFCMGCGVWRSKILLGGGTKPRYAHQPIPRQPVMGRFYHRPARQIYSLEKHSDPNPIVPWWISTTRKTIPFQKKMLRGNVQPFLVELDDKLYALGKSVTGASFEVFNPNDNGWSSLPYPPVNCLSYPFSIADSRAIFDQYFATAGKNILVSDGITSYWFDTTDPKQGWRGLDRFSFMGSTVIVDDGKQFVFFLFKPSNSDAQYVSVHLISYKFDNIKRDYSRVQLPTDFSKCRPDHLGDFPLTNYALVHVGGNTVCLVVSEQKKTFRCVTFKFQLNVGDEAASSFKIILLDTPMLVYEDIDMDMACSAGQDIDTDMAAGHMLGAFLL